MTVKEQTLVDLVKKIMPAKFLVKINDDTIILAYINLVLADINCIAPGTYYTIETMPASWIPIVAFGAQVFATLFLQAGYALNDFNYSNGGISLTIDRHSYLDMTYKNMLENYNRMIINIKKVEAMHVGIRMVNSPQFSSVFAQYLGSIFPGTVPMR
jgi:hypothetical protein